ncbi:MAG: hypothetical protein ABGY08_05100, partial [Gammaproteobacteria bacterium]
SVLHLLGAYNYKNVLKPSVCIDARGLPGLMHQVDGNPYQGGGCRLVVWVTKLYTIGLCCNFLKPRCNFSKNHTTSHGGWCLQLFFAFCNFVT